MGTATANTDRPAITLTYAQSLDGSIAARPGQPLALSGEEAQRFTHRLRASHDAILIGIGTVLADNPLLSVRLVTGRQPRPIILDSTLRCPIDARCLTVVRQPIVATTERASNTRRSYLEAAGVLVMRVPVDPANPSYLDLRALLSQLLRTGIRSIMVEGGARVITSFLQAHLVDQVFITIAPVLIGGVRGVTELLSAEGHFPRLRRATLQQAGADWIISGVPDWRATT